MASFGILYVNRYYHNIKVINYQEFKHARTPRSRFTRFIHQALPGGCVRSPNLALSFSLSLCLSVTVLLHKAGLAHEVTRLSG